MDGRVGVTFRHQLGSSTYYPYLETVVGSQSGSRASVFSHSERLSHAEESRATATRSAPVKAVGGIILIESHQHRLKAGPGGERSIICGRRGRFCVANQKRAGRGCQTLSTRPLFSRFGIFRRGERTCVARAPPQSAEVFQSCYRTERSSPPARTPSFHHRDSVSEL